MVAVVEWIRWGSLVESVKVTRPGVLNEAPRVFQTIGRLPGPGAKENANEPRPQAQPEGAEEGFKLFLFIPFHKSRARDSARPCCFNAADQLATRLSAG